MRGAFTWMLAALVVAGCGDGGIERLEWTVMGTVAAVQVRTGGTRAGAARCRDTAKAAFAEVERLLDAHDPGSEICRLAPLPDEEVLQKCDRRMRPCYEAAFRLARESGGAFNPRWRGEGTLDLGAIAKGFAVDLAAGGMCAGSEVLVDLGGNLKAVAPEGVSSELTVGVRDPGGDGIAATVRLRPGEALATSAEYFRGSHIYDGRTGRPAESGVASVTVLSRSAMEADALSTLLFVLGPEEARSFLEKGGYEASALFLMKDGRRATCGDAARFDIIHAYGPVAQSVRAGDS